MSIEVESVSCEKSSLARAASPPIWVDILSRLCAARGAKLWVEPEFGYAGYIERSNGSRHFFKGAAFDVNGAGAAALAKDKDYAARFLSADGLKVPEGVVLHSPRRRSALKLKNAALAERLGDETAGLEFAGRVGYPVFVKPNEGSEGEGVRRVGTPGELLKALAALFPHHERVLVQRAVRGADYRFIVLDGEVLAVFERQPLSLLGDGRSSIGDLLAQKLLAFSVQGKGARITPEDPRVTEYLAATGYDLATVPRTGERVALLANANLSTGGTALDVSAKVSPYYHDLARRAVRALGLRFAGLDLMCEDLAQTDTPVAGKYSIIEINACPGLSYFHGLGANEADLVVGVYERLLDLILRD